MFRLLVLSKIIMVTMLLMNVNTVMAAESIRVTTPTKVENRSGMRELARMEREIFGHDFTNETQHSRVSRLEEEIFGASQSGDINSRFDNLRAGYRGYNHTRCPQYSSYYAHQQYNNPYHGYHMPNPILRGTGGGGLKGLFHSIGISMLGGTPTGFSPQINPTYSDWYHDDPYFNSNGGYTRGFTSNRGYGYSNQNRGSGTTVTILD